MKIKVEIPYSHFLVIEADNESGLLLKALSHAKLVTSSGYGKDLIWKEAEPHQKLSFEIVADDFFAEKHDAIKKLTEENALTTKNWLKEYAEKNKIQKELNDLQEKIKAAGITFESN